MKFVKVLLCVFALLLLLLLTACSPQPSVSVSSSNPTASQSQPLYSEESQPETGGGLLPLAYFDSDEMLIAAIKEAKNNTSKNDDLDLASISELYKPATIPDDLSFKNIVVKKTYIFYSYINEEQTDYANFNWFREMKPEVAMNGLYGRGAISEREIEYNGIKYVFLEWADFETGKSDGYSIHWVNDNKAYGASIPAGWTDEEILALFC